MMMIMKYTTI